MENGGNGGFSNSEKKMGKTSAEMKYFFVISLELQIKTSRIVFFFLFGWLGFFFDSYLKNPN